MHTAHLLPALLDPSVLRGPAAPQNIKAACLATYIPRKCVGECQQYTDAL